MEANYPSHVGLIPDGNRRWAKKHKLPNELGHAKGIETLDKVARWALIETPIKYLTVYGLSTENVNRTFPELKKLFDMYSDQFKRLADDPEVHNHKIRIQVLGETGLLPDKLQEAIRYAEEKTKNYHDRVLSVALGYGGRQELIKAIKTISREVADGRLTLDGIDEHIIKENLYTDGMPYPDLIIRTSESRLSNFLTWQSAYSELAFVDKLFPDLTVDDIKKVLDEYVHRDRRYGK